MYGCLNDINFDEEKTEDYLRNFIKKQIRRKNFCFSILNPEPNTTDILLPYGM